jgi:peptidyl-prolyl cis-trans isomerase A (cyclophilin A)
MRMPSRTPLVAALILAALLPAVAADKPALTKPATLDETAPEVFHAKFETSRGDFVIEVHRDWAPLGADRFYNLVKNGFYDGTRFFRVLPGFVAQFGIHGDPALSEVWREAKIQDDPVVESNKAGYVSYAKAGPNSRTTQVFINLKDNVGLDQRNFPPFGRVTEGMDVVQQLYSGYGEGAPRGAGPFQGRIQEEGNAYLEKMFPKLDYIKKASLVQ